MIQKTVKKDYDLKDTILDYVIEKNEQEKGISIKSILENYSENLIIVDTNDIFVSENLELLSNSEKADKPIACLISDKMLAKMKNRTLNKLFIRSTNEKLLNSFIVKDKTEVYVIGNEERAYELDKKYWEKLFKLFNHLLWSKTNSELCQGVFSTIDSSKLSVLMPSLSDFVTDMDDDNLASTEEMEQTDAIIAKNYNEIIGYESGFITSNKFEGYLRNSGFYVSVYENKLVKVNSSYNLFKERFVTEQPISNYINKEIKLRNGNEVFVTSNDTFKVDEAVLLDEFMHPNVDKLCDKAKEKNDKVTEKLTVQVNLVPVTVDDTFKKHRNYKNLENKKANLDSLIDKLLNLKSLDKKELKNIEKIKEEHDFIQRAKLYNEYISKNELGVKSLNNKNKIEQFNLSKKDIIVPSDLLGTLYEKNNQTYLATNEKFYEEAVKWLKENQVEAKLIYDGR